MPQITDHIQHWRPTGRFGVDVASYRKTSWSRHDEQLIPISKFIRSICKEVGRLTYKIML